MARPIAILVAAIPLALASFGGVASAHEAGDRAVGAIELATPTRIVVRATDGHSVTFLVTKQTRFMDGARVARPEEATVGRRVVVEGRRTAEGVEATVVRLGVAPLLNR